MKIINTKACLVNKSSQRSMPKKTKNKKPEILRQILLSLLDELRTLYIVAEFQELKGSWFFKTCHGQRQDLCLIAEAVGVFLFGVYIQTHPRQMYFSLSIYIYVHTYKGPLLFLCGH